MEWTASLAENVTLSSDGNHAYVTGYNDNAVSWYQRNASTGAFDLRRMLKDGVNGVDGLVGASGVFFYQDLPFATNLKASFTFDDHFNSSVPIISGVNNGAVLVDDRFGNPNSALYFDGVDDTFNFSIDETLTDDFTISFWAKTDKQTSNIGEFTPSAVQVNFAFQSPQNTLIQSRNGGASILAMESIWRKWVECSQSWNEHFYNQLELCSES